MRNKKIADRLLLILFLVFLANLVLKIYFPNNFYIEMLNFVTEAALVGSIADWFAVTALFEKPLGFPWHTAIIPRNRVQVSEAIANMVENELLSKKTIGAKIEELHIIDSLIELFESNPANKAHVLKLCDGLSEKLTSLIDPTKISGLIENSLKDNLSELDLSVYLSKLLNFAIKNNECEKLFAAIIDQIILKVKEDKIRDEIANTIDKAINDNINKAEGFMKILMGIGLGIAKETNSVNTNDAATSIQEQIIEILDRLKDENDPLHKKFIEKIENIIEKLHEDSDLIENIEIWKQETIKKLSVKDDLSEIIMSTLEALKFGIKKEVALQNGTVQNGIGTSVLPTETIQLYTENITPMIDFIKVQLNKYWNNFKTNEIIKSKLESYMKDIIYKLLKSSHSFIGIVVRKVLNNMTDESLNNFIQLKAGNDLHWIRINGCIIGGIFGLLVFLFVNELYLPIIQLLFH